MEQVCDVVPGSYKSGCEAFVKTYTPQLIDLFLQDVTPQLICSSLMLCPEQHEKVKLLLTRMLALWCPKMYISEIFIHCFNLLTGSLPESIDLPPS